MFASSTPLRHRQTLIRSAAVLTSGRKVWQGGLWPKRLISSSPVVNHSLLWADALPRMQMGNGWQRWQASLAGMLERGRQLLWGFLRLYELCWKVAPLRPGSPLYFEWLKQKSFCASSVDERLILARHRLACFVWFTLAWCSLITHYKHQSAQQDIVLSDKEQQPGERAKIITYW